MTSGGSAGPIVWGSEVVAGTVRGFPCRVFARRPPNLAAVLADAARWGERTYLADDSVRLSYAETVRLADAGAAVLAGHGVRRGDRVLLLGANSAAWVVWFWAVTRRGGVPVFGNAWWSADEVAYAVDLVTPALVLTDERCVVRVPEGCRAARLDALPEGPGRGADTGPAGSGRGVDAEPAGEDDPAAIVFTSGTSGPAKAAVLSHGSAIANQQNLLARSGRMPSDLGPDYRPVVSLLSTPLFHLGGLQALLSGLLVGGTMVLQTGRFDPVTTMTLIQRERVAVWSGVPTTVGRVVEHPRRGEFDLSSLRVLAMGGAPLPPRMLADAATAMPGVRRGVSANYGLTEAGGSVATARGEELLSHPGCSGRPLPAIELRIDRSPDREADPEPGSAATGEILVRGPSVMSGYWPLDGPAPVDADGWLRTGDVGYLDADGFLYVTDRVRDIVIRGGENVSASHVEFTLCEHPGVAAAVVVGLPHADLGEEVAAVLVARTPDLRVDELIDAVRVFVAARLAHFEVPSRWWVHPGPLPENATGKIDKKVLRAEWPSGDR